MTQPSRIVVGLIEPVSAEKLIGASRDIARRKLKEHTPLRAPPDFDHPLVKALVARMPHLPYREIEAVKAHLETHDARSQTSPRVVDGMLQLVNEELQRRDREREHADLSFVDWLTKKGLAQ